MKMKSDMWHVASDRMKSATRKVHSCHVSRVTPVNGRGRVAQLYAALRPHPQRGVALIITLILLSVVTFMAITFLALSRRERSAVSTVTDTASARLAADAALANAEAQIMANVLSTTNPYNFGLLVSTNYINPEGYIPALGANPTNVNYYDSSGNFLSGNHFLQNLENLYYSPRPPVFIVTNSAGSNDFRFYLDLNRNGMYDRSGPILETNILGLGTGNTVTNVGDPEWIGVLQRPDQPYGPNNPFVARYAFIAVPVGNTLDLNAIHNQAQQGLTGLPGVAVNPPPIGYDAFSRNEGVGSWEINLAAFLVDLNTNEWDNKITGLYQYPPSGLPGPFAAFDDARALLAYRYNNNLNTLSTVGAPNNLFGTSGINAFSYNHIDGFSYGGSSLMTGFQLPAIDNDSTLIGNKIPWVGADNTNHFFTPEELFNTSETTGGVVGTNNFPNRLLAAGNGISTYDRYTFYRLLSQLGTDSTPESGKMNLNYDNLNPYFNGFLNTNGGVAASTNFVAWQPLAFFTNAADRMLRAYTTQWRNSNPTSFATNFYSVPSYFFTNANFSATNFALYPAFGIGNIPVLVSNQFVYSPAVNRLLQLAANMYDATTNSFYPSVFRPYFSRDFYGNLFITGYTNVDSVSGVADSRLSQPFDASQVLLPTGSNVFVNVYGVPWIIGAKKGFPNFNKFTMQNVVQITRKLQIARSKIPTTSISDLLYTNQQYIFSITNFIGMDCWNSYSASYPNPVQIVVQDNLAVMLTNGWGAPNYYYLNPPYLLSTNLTVTLWSNSEPWVVTSRNSPPSPNPYSFVMPITNAIQVMTNSVFYFGTTPPPYLGFWPAGMNLGWETNKHDFTFPNFGLLTTNRVQLYMLDGATSPYHIIDYVQFAGPQSSRNLNAEIQTNAQSSGYANMWSTALNTYNVPYGIISQIDVSRGADQADISGYWPNKISPSTMQDEIDGFFVFMGGSPTAMPYPIYTAADTNTYRSYATNYIVQVPYTPTVTTYEYTSWQANDPLVHYMASDLNFYGTEANEKGPKTGINVLFQFQSLTMPYYFFNTNGNNKYLNDRYSPWGWSKVSTLPSGAQSDPNPLNLAYKDPLVSSSDNWNFPTNKFPGVGWLGRVHRGTPWQTVYLKATNILNWIQSGPPYATGTNTWENWTGNVNPTNAADGICASYTTYSTPVQDWLLFDLFTTAFNDNSTRGTLSVNVGPTNANLAAWSALLSGIVVPPVSPTNTYSVIAPAGPAGLTSPLGVLVANINQTRATFTNADGLVGTFEHVGDILAVPALTERSPFLNPANTSYNNDEMFEWLPQQTMSLLRCSGSPRYVIYSYGQALKPAPNGIYTGGDQFFGMVTNYQVVSEIATRAVVRFGSTLTNIITTSTFPVLVGSNFVQVTGWTSVPVVTNNNAVIESFNILPPD